MTTLSLMMRKAVEGTRDQMKEVNESFGRNELSEEEQVARYLKEHRGNLGAILSFAQENVGADGMLEEAARYEAEMEKLARKRLLE